MRIAIVHPWYLAFGGAEQTVSAIGDLYPDADLFTLFYRQQDLPENLQSHQVFASSLNWLPGKYGVYRYLLPAYPLLFESLDLRGYDLVITSDSCVTKGVLIDQNAVQICYCHSPMRCLWDMYRDFSSSRSALARPIFTLGTHYVRQWDFNAAQRVDSFIANSRNVSERIRKFYNRESTLIYPPVRTEGGFLAERQEDFYLTVGRMTDVKRVDLLIRACNRLGRRLVVVGGGREERRLKSLAGPTIEFPGRISESQLSELYARCRAFLFAANEDFGIVPVEAQAYGRPVIAFGKGGSLETVISMDDRLGRDPTGVFFAAQEQASVENGILEFERVENRFVPKLIQSHARQFDIEIFNEKFKEFVAGTMANLTRNLSLLSIHEASADRSIAIGRGLR
jgi:glycosyltransferase involved in cell wall biosynthesis